MRTGSALLARRLRRAEATIEFAVDAAAAAVTATGGEGGWSGNGPIMLDAEIVPAPAGGGGAAALGRADRAHR